MADQPTAHPKNVRGPFYVQDGCCTACDVPNSEAPDHFEYDADGHCYVSRQPETQEELTKMIRVVWSAELQCIRYRGNEPAVLRRLAEMELRDVCDVQPPVDIQPLIRNHVRFTDSEGSRVTSKQLLEHFIAYLYRQRSEYLNYKIKRIKTSTYWSSCEFAWYEKNFHPVRFNEIPKSSNDWHVEYPLRNDLGDRGVGNVISAWLQAYGDRFIDIRWYSYEEWKNGGPSQSTLW